jgi:hypothetical protein
MAAHSTTTSTEAAMAILRWRWRVVTSEGCHQRGLLPARWAGRQHRGGPAAAPAARGTGQGARAGAALKQLNQECELRLTGRVWWGVGRLAEAGKLGSVGFSSAGGAGGGRHWHTWGETVCTLF